MSKEEQKKEKREEKIEGFREGYEVRWMEKEGPSHPDYYKVFPEKK
jgi:hypothetical protein